MAVYTKLSVHTTEAQSEILSAYLSDFPFDSFDYDGELYNAYAPQSALEPYRDEVEALLEEEGFVDFFFEDIEAENWNAAWESDFEEVDVDGRVLIRAPFHAPRSDYGGMEVIIQPKMSFGTGHHATTQMMVEMLLDGNVAGKRILDMGSGTGVLAIVAAKLGAKSVFAVEIDDMAEESVRENIALNGVEDRVESVCGDARAIEGKNFDVVLANINRNILLNDMAAYCATLAEGGSLVISGFLAEDVEVLVDYATTLNLSLIRHKSNGEWQSLAFVRG
ncbi:MAG: 50S ribosomal protein L11 methyltransferase [Alistipes sp.]|nr:50S ribosomal protein L11 methyltransferase [Alistipes sp.]